MKHACTMKISQRFTVWVRSSFPTWVEKPGSTSKGQKVTLCKLGVFLLFLCLQAIHKLAFYPNKQAVLVAHLQAFFSLCTYSHLYPCFCPPLSPMTTGNPSNLGGQGKEINNPLPTSGLHKKYSYMQCPYTHAAKHSYT